jgi:hypothetical protein
VTTYTVTDDIILGPNAARYFTTADRRIRDGFRAALTMLDIPIPDYAQPRKSKLLAAALAGDPGRVRTNALPPRKPNASPEAVAAAKARTAQRLGY